MGNHYFLNMLQALRHHEEIVLYNNILHISKEDAAQSISFLQQEYHYEMLDAPFEPPSFDRNAGLWAAQTVYVAAQLILYRQHGEKDLTALLPDYSGLITPAAILSADLCLRFLPDMIQQIKLIDSEDVLIEIMEKLLTLWHYSGVRYDLAVENLVFDHFENNDCVKQLYANRALLYKKHKLIAHPFLQALITANLGIYKDVLCKI